MWMSFASEEADGWGAWLQSWWNTETLGPDLLVGLATGVAVGVFVSRAEKRTASREASRLVANGQAAIVGRARSVLSHDVRFMDAQLQVLHPDRSLLEGLTTSIAALPAGLPATHVPGYRWVRDLCDAVTETEALADALDRQIDAIDRAHGNTGSLGIWVRRNIVSYADADSEGMKTWGWDWHPQIPDTGRRAVAADSDLWLLILQYARQRRLIFANRAAFIDTMAYLRKEEHKAYRALAETRGGRIRQWRARRAARSAIEASRVWADSQAQVLVSDVDPHAV